MSILRIADYEAVPVERERLPRTIANRTRRIYDVVSAVYPMSTFFFHSKAHQAAVEMAGITDGARVLEVATGSGEMFRRIVKANGKGDTIGVDISPKMAAKTQRQVRRDFPNARTHCQAVDARYLPFRDHSFDAVVCCYLLELLAHDDIVLVLDEIHRVLRPAGTFALVCIGENAGLFNRIYQVAGSLAPAFWGRQVDHRVPKLIQACGFGLATQRVVRQSGYPSHVLTARKK